MRKLARKPKSEKGQRGRPRASRISVPALNIIPALQIEFGLSGAFLTYRAIAEELSRRSGIKVSAGVVYRYGQKGDKHVEPHDPALRKALGLPIKIEVEACPRCGIVHVAKTCPARDRFAERAAHYDRWRAAHAAEIARVVAWAESQS